MTTLKDIAAELNLSVNTISRALRDMPDISRETKKLVVETARRMGYRKNLAASRLRTNRSNLLGVVVTSYQNPAFSRIILGAEHAVKAAGYTLLVGSTNENGEEEETVVSRMLSQGIDGLLLIPSELNEKLLGEIEADRVPYVLAVRQYAGHRSHVVGSDDVQGGVMAARHLYELGHRSFLYVSGMDHISSSRDRYAGFLSELQCHGLDRSAIEVLPSNGGREDARRVMLAWLQRHTDRPLPATAVFAFSDYVACGIYEALRTHGLKIPRDISVIGYDNNEFSDLILPGLSSIDNHFFDIGQRAAVHLLSLISQQAEGQTIAPVEDMIPPTLVIRGSTAPPSDLQPG